MSVLLCRRVHLLRLHLLPTPLLRSLATTAPAAPTASRPIKRSSSFTVDFLTTSCGLTPAQALSATRAVHFDEQTRQQPESVLAVLRSHGFSDAQITEIVTRFPRVLLCGTQNILDPKLRFLTQEGLSPGLIARCPWFLLRSLDGHLRPCFEFFRRFVGSVDELHTLFLRAKWTINFNLKATAVPNVGLLLEQGVAPLEISRLMVSQPQTLMTNHERFAGILQTVQDWGVKPDKKMFLHTVRILCAVRKSTLTAKSELLKKLGWSEEEVLKAFRMCPPCIGTSAQKIVLVNSFAKEVGLGPSDICRLPHLLLYSFDKRILPRYAVWQVLTSKRLIKQGIKRLVPMFGLSEERFLHRYVKKYMDKVPELMDVYLGKIKVDGLDIPGDMTGYKSIYLAYKSQKPASINFYSAGYSRTIVDKG